METVELDRVELTSAEKVKQAVIAAWERNNSAEPGDQFLSVGTVAGCLLYKVNFAIAIANVGTAHGNEHSYVEFTKEANKPLFNMVSSFFDELKGHVKNHGLTSGVFAYFNLDLDGNHPDMTTDQLLLDVSANVDTGTASMVAAGYPINVAFTAAEVATLRAAFLIVVNTKTNKKQLSANAESAEEIMEVLAKGFGDKVYQEAKARTIALGLEIGAARDFMRTYGIQFEAPKEKTLVPVEVLLTSPLKGAGAEIRIGPILTARGKPSKEGVRGSANSQGNWQGETTAEHDTYVNVRILNYLDAHVPITPNPGGSHPTVIVQMVPGVSSL